MNKKNGLIIGIVAVVVVVALVFLLMPGSSENGESGTKVDKKGYIKNSLRQMTVDDCMYDDEAKCIELGDCMSNKLIGALNNQEISDLYESMNSAATPEDGYNSWMEGLGEDEERGMVIGLSMLSCLSSE